MGGATAWALLDELHVHAGEWIAINAATSAVALLVADLAARVLAITRGTPLAGYLDCVGGMMIKNMLPALKVSTSRRRRAPAGALPLSCGRSAPELRKPH